MTDAQKVIKRELDKTNEDGFLRLCRLMGLPEPVREYHFAESLGREWRFDFCWPGVGPGAGTAVEVDGGVHIRGGGRHNRAAGFTKDHAKMNAANELGWHVYRYTRDQLEDGSAIRQLERVLMSPALDRPATLGRK